MRDKNTIIEMTPFIFEDGNTYYFNIVKRDSSRDYVNLFVYKKRVSKGFWSKKTEYIKLNEDAELVSINLDTRDIKYSIKKILIATKADYKLKNWDGFVGDVPDDIKKSLNRNRSISDILGE